MKQELHRRPLRQQPLSAILVNTFMPSVTGVAQAGSGFGGLLDFDQAHAAIRSDAHLS